MAVFRSSTQAKRHRREASKKSVASAYTMDRTRSPLPPASPQAPLYSVIEDFRRGVLPSNSQLIRWIKAAQASPVLHPSPKLSAAGAVFVQDVQELLGLLGRVIEEKNADGALQQFMHHARLAGRLAVAEIGRGPSGRLPVIDEPQRKVYLFGAKDANMEMRQRTMRKQAGRNVRALYRLAQLVLTSVDFREMIRDWQQIVNRIMSEGQGQGGEEEEALEEEPLALQSRKTFRMQSEMLDGRGDQKDSERYSPLLHTRTSSSGSKLDETLMDLRSRVEHTEEDLERLRMGGTSFNRPSSTTMSESYYTRFERDTGTIRSASPLTPQSPRIVESKKWRIPEPIVSEKGPPQRNILFEEEATVPEIQSAGDPDKLILQDMIPLFKNLSDNAQFRGALGEAYAVMMRLQTGTDLSATTEVAPELRYDANLIAAQRDLRHLLERFSSNQSLDPSIHAIKSMQRDMAQDYAFKDFVQDWQTFLQRCLSDPAYPGHEEYFSRGHYLLDRTRGYRRSKYGDTIRTAYQNLRDVIDGWQRDELTRELGRVLRKILQQDLIIGGGSGGGGQQQKDQSPLLIFINALRRPEILSDLRGHFIPQLLKGLYELPIPRVEAFQNGTHLVLEDLSIPADSFLPVDFDVQTVSRFRVNPRQKLLGKSGGSRRLVRLERAISGTPGWQNSMRIRLAAIRTDLRDIRFHLERATGWPRIRDEGLADMSFGGTGMTVLINVAASTALLGQQQGGAKDPSRIATTPYSIVDPRLVSVRIDRLKLKLHSTSRE